MWGQIDVCILLVQCCYCLLKNFFLATTSTDPSPICHRQHVKWVMVKTVRAKWGETEWCLSCHAVPGNCAQKGNLQKALAKLSKISSKKWGILDHSCFSLLYKQITQISTLFQSAKYTPQYYPTQAHCFIRYDCSLIKGFLFATNFNNKSSQRTKLAFSRQL